MWNHVLTIQECTHSSTTRNRGTELTDKLHLHPHIIFGFVYSWRLLLLGLWANIGENSVLVHTVLHYAIIMRSSQITLNKTFNLCPLCEETFGSRCCELNSHIKYYCIKYLIQHLSHSIKSKYFWFLLKDFIFNS